MAVVKKNKIRDLKNKIYLLLNQFFAGKPDSEKREILEQLYPGESSLKKYRDFQIRKFEIMTVIIAAGMAAAIYVHLSSRMQNRLAEGTRLYRNEWGEGSYFITLHVATDSGEGEFVYEVKERILTEDELRLLREQAAELLPEIVRANNESLMMVREDLSLPAAISGYPFTISWQSSDYSRIRSDGKVNTEALPQEGTEVELTAELSYKEEKWKQKIAVKLLPQIHTQEEQYLSEVKSMILENDRIYEKNHEIFLPERIGSEYAVWEETKKDSSFLLLILGFLGAVLTSFLTDRVLEKRGNLRRKEIEENYSEFVSKLQLYMGAGLTVKNAFLKIGRDYQMEKGKTGKMRYLYEEILIADYQLSNGRPEYEVYREWGRRCGEMKYRKLGFLLTSHIRQGNHKILMLLTEEIDAALEERKNEVRKQGEEAGTKLLFPMMMQLVVVMFLILMPVFSDFGSM